MPTPQEDETREDFLDRCMSDDEAVSDFPDDDQRFAFCQSQWENKTMSEAKTYKTNGNALKTVGKTDDRLRVANYMVLWGGEDLEGERFLPETEFESSYTKTGALYVDWEHGTAPDGTGPERDDVLGYVDWSTAKKDENGLFVERVLDRRAAYMEHIEELIEEGMVGTSTEAVPGKVFVDKDGNIKRWPLKRDALTVTPAEPRMISENAITAIKALSDRFPELKSAIQEAPAKGDESETEREDVDNKQVETNDKELDMGEKEQETKNTPEVSVEDLEDIRERIDAESKETGEKVDKLTENVNKVLGYIEEMPASKSAGYHTGVGGDADPEHKSFGDFLLAIKREDKKRLDKVYKAMSGESGAGGGYLVPEEFANDVYMVADENGVIYPRVEKVPVDAPSGKYPALDQYVTPSAGVGDTALAGGLTAQSLGESEAGSGDQPQFKMLEWALNKVGEYVEVPSEMNEDAQAATLETLLTRLFGLVIANKREYQILRGTGANEALGMLNADCAVAVSAGTSNSWGMIDGTNMLSQFKPVGGTPVWLAHREIIPDLQSDWQAGTAGVDFVQPREGMGATLLGYEFLFSEHLPQADNSGMPILVDPSAYVVFEKGGLQIDFSEHAKFESDEVVWRYKERFDGQPWLQNSITLADPQGSYAMSPIVYNDN